MYFKMQQLVNGQDKQIQLLLSCTGSSSRPAYLNIVKVSLSLRDWASRFFILPEFYHPLKMMQSCLLETSFLL